MVDDLKSLKDNLFKVLANRGQQNEGTADDDRDVQNEGNEGSFIDSRAARAIMGTLFAKAGKSKDDVVQILAREIGMAVAGMLKQPLSQLAKNQKLQISFEFVPKNVKKADADEESEKKSSAKPKVRKTSKTSPKSKTRK